VGIGPKGGTRLAPEFVEWMQGLPAGWVTDVPEVSWRQQLTLLGNGVVPMQAAAALSLLLQANAEEAIA
jgi:DNA (cytosine-5)-methyltransferase 1